jgi:nucleotide-binding universal stress UspA family protein
VFQTIVVGTDGSETAREAVRRAAELARLSGGTLHIVSAYRPVSAHKLDAQRRALPEEFRWSLSADAELQNTLQAALLMATEAGATAQTVGRVGDPVDVILSTAEELNADLIVIGSKGIERRILGSVPNSVVHDAQCDVLVVHTA